MASDIKLTLKTTYHVVAYDASWGGYGDDCSRDFTDEAEAIAYARRVRDGQYPGGPRYDPKLFRRMSVELERNSTEIEF